MNRRMFLMAGGGMTMVRAAPAEQVVLGVIGSGSRGKFVMSIFQKDPSLRVGAVCDVYEPNLEKALSMASKTQAAQPVAYRNYKQLLADKNIQAVLIATPEHWHAQMVLDALAAGKDVYVEKPLCQTPEQGIALVEAEKKTKNIIQVGMQPRSYDLYLEGRDRVASGQLGAVRMVRSWWLNNYLGDRKVTRLEGGAGLGTVAGTCGAGPSRPRSLCPLEVLRGVFRRYPGRPGRARVRWHSSLDGSGLSVLDCVRTRKTPTAPMRVAFQAALVVQLANMSLKDGRRYKWNAAAGKVEA